MKERCALDFVDIKLMDGSFADEVFGTIAAARGRRQLSVAPLVLLSLNPTSQENLEQALLSRPIREDGLRNCVVPVQSDDGEIVLVGKSEEHVQQTLSLLNAGGELTTREIAKKLNLGTAAASTRLKVLYDLGLAVRLEVRDDQGKQFVYQSIG
jgi:DNA-binding transcriptional ArsR family regulator